MSVGHSTVDERVVEMRIDNEKFEAGAKKTIGILESLDRSLKGLGQDNADGFDNIEKSLDKVTDRFSAMGIVGDQVMRNLTNKAIEMVGQFKNMATMLTTQQIDAGWNKYADKTQAIQTIMAATSGKIDEGFFANQAEQMSWVNEQIEKLNKFTDETSYNFLDMVGNIGKFTAAGRELEESVTAMEGIANWAAISGGRPAEAGRAMYNLSQALGMGAVTTIDWKSIENANMATYEFKQQAIDAAVEMGTLKKVADGVWETMEGGFEVTVENFRNSLSFGRGTDAIHWFNSDVLLSVLNRYGDFSDKLLEVVDGTELTVTNYLKLLKAYKEGDSEFQEQIENLSLTSDEVRALLPDLERLSAAEYDLGFRAFQAAQEAKTFTEAIDATKDAVSTKWMTVFELLFGNYLEAKELWTSMAETFWNIFAKPVDHLIDIIENAQGFLGMDGWVAGFSGEMEQAAGGTEILEDRLHAVGKDMKDFHKALETVIGGEAFHRLIQDYHDVDNALLQGAISADTFKKALGVLDDTFDSKKPVTLNRALNKAGKTMGEFEKALKDAMDPKDVVNVLGSYESIEDAFRNGAISVEDFKEALASLGIDSENVTEEIDQNVQASIGSLDELRQFALEVLRGDHGSGAERIAWYEQMGLDPELMQAMAGDLKNMGYYISDEMLMAAMESYYQFNNLSARLGYETFAEYLASITSATSETVYDINQMANEADNIYASLFGSGVLDDVGKLHSAGELFRTSLTNLLDALDEFGKAFDKAFLKVFGGSEDYDESILNMSDGFFTLTAAFYSFSESVLKFSKSDAFLNFATAMFSILRLIGKTISFVFKIGKIGLSVILKLLSPVLKLATTIFNAISAGLDTMGRAFESSGIIEFIDEISDILLKKISEPIDKINNVIDKLVKAFKEGFGNGGGIVGGLRKMSATMDQLFENHPVFLTVIHAIGRAIIFLKDAAAGAALVLGSVFGGAIALVVAVFQQLGSWFSQFVNWAKSSDLVTDIWIGLTNALKKFGEVVERVYDYAKQGYQENGFMGALSAIAASFERGVKRLVPGGEKLLEIFNSVKSAFTGLFKRKVVDENGVETVIDDTNSGLLKLEESLEKTGGFLNVVREGAMGDESQQADFKERVKTFVGNLWDGFLEGLEDIRISDVIAALRLGVIANVLLKVGHGLNIFNSLADSISDVPDRLADMFEDLGQTFRSLSFSIKANSVMKFAAAAALIAGAIFLLSKIPEDKIEKASSVVLSILLVLSLFTSALGKTSASILNSFQYLFSFGTALMGFAAIVASIGTTALILAAAAKFIGVNELKEATKTILSIVAAIAGLILLLTLTVRGSKFNEWQIKALGAMMKGIGSGLMGLALAVQMLVLPILTFCLVLKLARGEAGLKKFNRAVFAVVGILLAIGLMTRLITAAVNGFTADQIGRLGTFMIKLAASLMIVALAINMLAAPILILAAAQKAFKLNVNGIVGAISIFMILGFLFAGILAIFAGSMSKKDAAQIQAVGTMLLKLAASMLVISFAIGLLTKPIIKIAELCERMNDLQILKSLAILAITIGALAGLLVLLNKVVLKGKGGANSLGLGKGLFRIAEAIFLLAAAALVLTPAIILMTAAIAGLTYILGNMPETTWEIFEKGLERLGKFAGPLAKFGGALLIVGLAATLTGTGIIAMSAGILIFAAAIAIIMMAMPKVVDVFERLRSVDLQSLWSNIGKIMLILGSFMIILIMVMSTINRIYSLLGGGIFKNIGKNFLETIQDIVYGLRDGVSNGFTKVIEFLKNEDNKKALLAAVETIILLGASYAAGLLPTFAKVVVGGVVGLVNNVATEINAQSSDIVDAITNIVDAILTIFKDLAAKMFGEESWSEMSWWQKGIADLGGGLLVANKIAGLFSFGKAEDSAKSLADMIFGVTEKIGDLKTGFGETKAAVELFIESAGGLAAVIPVALVLASALAYANHELNAQQDILRQNAGDPKTLEEYADSIAQVETRIAELTEQSKNGLGTELSEQELQAQQLLLVTLQREYEELKASMAETQEVADTSVRSTNEFASGIKDAKDAMDMLKSVDLSKYGYTMEQISRMGDVELVRAARTIEQDLGQAWAGVAKSATDATVAMNDAETAVTESASVAENASNGIKELFNTEMISGLFGDFDIGGAFKEAVANQGIDVNDLLTTDGTGIDTEKFKSLVDVERLKTDLAGQLKDVGEVLPEGMADGIPAGEGYMAEALGGMKDFMLETLFSMLGIASPSTVMRDEVGQYIPAGIGVGIEENYYQAVNPLYTLMDEMTNAFTGMKDHFAASGAQVVSGLAQGIVDNMQYAYNIGQSLAGSLENGFRNRLAIRSPSRVFAELARYIPLGIEEGVSSESSSAITSITVLGDALINAIMQSMVMVSTIADEDFELAPRIVPVVDMTNVDSAADSMSGLFGNGYAMSAQMSGAINRRLADVERLAANMGNSQTINNGDNITFNIYGAEGQDPNEIADAVMIRMQNRAVRREAAFG